jgi:5-methylcytosine-specific restriction endonuclease McrBC GTP-binding regulatory subunit McrB
MKVFLAGPKGLNSGTPNDYDEIKIPDNMFIWATMNSADQGVFPMDTAFKRRWDFAYLGIDEGESDVKGSSAEAVEKWIKFRKAINNRLISLKINEDKLLGPFFVNEDNLSSIETFDETFKHKVLMYLYEDAAKQKRNDLFEKPNARYSELCEAYDDDGMQIFKELDV